MPLFWRVFLANAVVFVAGLLVLSLGRHARPSEALDVAVGLIVMVVVNWVALRPLFRPLERLAAQMEDADVLRAGRRVAAGGPGEVAALERSFNEMMQRLEDERRDSGARALHAREQERARISRSLHDEVGQTMTGVLLQLRRLRDGAGGGDLAELDEAEQAVRASLEDVRRIARELRPEVLDHLGLVSALISLCDGFGRRAGLAVERRLARDLPPLGRDAELAVYRVAQESLTNVARHAGAGRVEVTLSAAGRGAVLRVADDGRGLAGAGGEGGGIRGMRERALIVGGELTVRSPAGGGVEVVLDVPAGEPV